jgi:hypothetical protein
MHPPPFRYGATGSESTRIRRRKTIQPQMNADGTILDPSAWDDEKEGKNGNRELRTRIREP